MLKNKFAFTTWVYRNIDVYPPEELDRQVNSGINISMTSPFDHNNERHVARIKEYLNKASELGIQLILHCDFTLDYYVKLGKEEYSRQIVDFYENVLEKHPAVYGFFVSDEPNTTEDAEAVRQTIITMKEVMPNLMPYVNLMGSSAHLDESVFGGPHSEWIKKLHEDAGDFAVSYDMYSQMVNDGGGTTIYFGELKRNEKLCVDAGLVPIACLICSAHMVFGMASEYDFGWQISTAAAAGYKGINWFRYYDSPIVPNYHASPVDEFGNNTERYYHMLRAQRRFSFQYGDIIMKLKRKATYVFGEDRQRGAYPRFKQGTHDKIKDIRVGFEESMVSFFEHEDTGEEYMIIVNLSRKFYDHYEILCADGYDVVEVLENGARENKFRVLKSEDDDFEGEFLYPGQMTLIKIFKK